MIRDLERDPLDALPDYDICIVGSGPAGVTVAAELAGSGLRVCILESGKRKPTRHGDELRRVTSEGIFVKDYSRERALGGASTTWAGLSSPFDPVDFERRDYVSWSGWPITRDELMPFYAEAGERYRFPKLEFFQPTGFAEVRRKGELQPDWEAVEEKVFLAADPPQNFGREQLDFLEGPDVDVYLDATVTELRGTGSRVRSAAVRTRKGAALELRAETFVIGCGGIENARLLLNSTDLEAAGLGNEHDQVGRYFMNHPKNYHGVIEFANPPTDEPYFFGCLYSGFAGYGGIRLPEAVQRKRGLMNSYVRLEPLFPWSDSEGIEALVLLVKKSQFLLKRFKPKKKGDVVVLRDYSETGDDSDLSNERKTTLGWFAILFKILADLPKVSRYLFHRLFVRAAPKIKRARLRNFMEMEPTPENRIVLSEEVDANGMRLPHAIHDTTELDRRSLVAIHEALGAELERLGIGRLESDLGRADPWPITQDASHHMGTTRMGSDPRTSVVNRDGRLHGVDNVYMAGASVLPTSGCANPTFTLVALAIRLARHLLEAAPTGRGPTTP